MIKPNRLDVLITACILLLISTACSQSQPHETSESPVELTVSAAASLTDALSKLKPLFEAKYAHITLRLNIGGSGALQRQIEQGAPSDLFLSASVQNMQDLVDQGLIAATDRVYLLDNALVAITPINRQSTINELSDLSDNEDALIAIGTPESVPAGHYAREAFIQAGIWDDVQGRTVQAKDVRTVLRYVETENTDIGIVYLTDALASDQVKIAFTIDSALHAPIRYPIGIIQSTAHRAQAEAFYTFLQSEEAGRIFTHYGFHHLIGAESP